MSSMKYVNMLLVECEDGTQALVSVPISTASKDDIVLLCGGKQAKVIRSEWIDPKSAIYEIVSAVVPVHEPEAVYSYRLKWQKEDTSDEAHDDT